MLPANSPEGLVSRHLFVQGTRLCLWELRDFRPTSSAVLLENQPAPCGAGRTQRVSFQTSLARQGRQTGGRSCSEGAARHSAVLAYHSTCHVDVAAVRVSETESLPRSVKTIQRRSTQTGHGRKRTRELLQYQEEVAGKILKETP